MPPPADAHPVDVVLAVAALVQVLAHHRDVGAAVPQFGALIVHGAERLGQAGDLAAVVLELALARVQDLAGDALDHAGELIEHLAVLLEGRPGQTGLAATLLQRGGRGLQRRQSSARFRGQAVVAQQPVDASNRPGKPLDALQVRLGLTGLLQAGLEARKPLAVVDRVYAVAEALQLLEVPADDQAGEAHLLGEVLQSLQRLGRHLGGGSELVQRLHLGLMPVQVGGQRLVPVDSVVDGLERPLVGALAPAGGAQAGRNQNCESQQQSDSAHDEAPPRWVPPALVDIVSGAPSGSTYLQSLHLMNSENARNASGWWQQQTGPTSLTGAVMGVPVTSHHSQEAVGRELGA